VCVCVGLADLCTPHQPIGHRSTLVPHLVRHALRSSASLSENYLLDVLAGESCIIHETLLLYCILSSSVACRCCIYLSIPSSFSFASRRVASFLTLPINTLLMCTREREEEEEEEERKCKSSSLLAEIIICLPSCVPKSNCQNECSHREKSMKFQFH
jgi:hypothetical protein